MNDSAATPTEERPINPAITWRFPVITAASLLLFFGKHVFIYFLSYGELVVKYKLKWFYTLVSLFLNKCFVFYEWIVRCFCGKTIILWPQYEWEVVKNTRPQRDVQIIWIYGTDGRERSDKKTYKLVKKKSWLLRHSNNTGHIDSWFKKKGSMYECE